MTTVVLTPDFILADCRVTATINLKDQAGNDIKVIGVSDAYCKIGDLNVREHHSDHLIENYALFGEIATAEALVALAKATGFSNATEVLAAVGMLRIDLPKDPTGFAWVNGSGRMSWLIIEDGQYRLVDAPDGTRAVALGSGREFFYNHFEENHDVTSAFIHALKRDRLSSDTKYDHWDRESGVVTRHDIKLAGVQTLEELLPTLAQPT